MPLNGLLRQNELGREKSFLQAWIVTAQRDGYDIELTRLIADNVSVPVIASGGAGTKEHFTRL